MTATILVIIHGLVAVALLGAITHQTLATWAPTGTQRTLFINRFRSVPPVSFANAIIVLYLVAVALGAVVYLDFRIDVRPQLERDHHFAALGLFDLKEHFVSIGLGLLPAYWVAWRRPLADDLSRTRAALTAILAFIVWWGFLMGHVLNNILGFGS
jgi:hypothetical protein